MNKICLDEFTQDQFSGNCLRNYITTAWAVKIFDILVLFLASQLALVMRFDALDEFSPYGAYATLLGLLLATNIFSLFGLYDRRSLFAARTILRIVPAWTLSVLILIAVGFATQTTDDVSRIWAGLWFGCGLVGVIGCRCALAWVNGWSAEATGPSRRIALVGSGPAAVTLGRQLVEGHAGNYRLLGTFGDEVAAAGMLWPSLGNLDDLIAYCRADRLDEIVIIFDGHEPERTKRWLNILRHLPVNVTIVPTIADYYMPLRGVRRLGHLDVISVAERPFTGLRGLIKRLEDIVVASLAVTLTASLMLLISLAVKLDSRGPVFFRQIRYGLNNEKIEILKFRTMRVADDADSDGEFCQATRDDPRVTRIGRWLRRTSFDELPQFFHVLSGKMSVVGPRPHAVYHHHKYVELIDLYSSRHRVKPGITGWAQVNGLRGETSSVDMMKKRIDYDLYYVENWSLELDLLIILRTMLTGMAGKNAY